MIKQVACVLVGLSLAVPSFACVIGNPANPPTITITTSPPDCCYGNWAGTVAGSVNNVDTDLVGVVLYARTNDYYVQPDDDPPWTPITCPAGTFSNATRGGCQYWAILAKRTWSPPATLFEIPPIGGDILAFDCSLDSEPTGLLAFAERRWIVKACCSVAPPPPCGPGKNWFSASSENVWVDNDRQLHLRITERNGRWYCAEVLSDHYLGYGLYQYEIASPVDDLDQNVVFSGFTYSDDHPTDHDEIDIEFSRWGEPNAENAQFVVQPYQRCLRDRFFMNLTGEKSTHEFLWASPSIRFASRQGGFDQVGQEIAAYTYTTSDPECFQEPDVERMRFILWLYNADHDPGGIGDPPSDGQEVEVIVSDFRFADWPTAVEPLDAPPPSLILDPPVPNPAGGSIEYQIKLDEAAQVTVSVYDAAGRHIDRILDRELGAGTRTLVWSPPKELPSGVYWLQLDAAGEKTTRSFVLSR